MMIFNLNLFGCIFLEVILDFDAQGFFLAWGFELLSFLPAEMMCLGLCDSKMLLS